ncbi:MAG TPA: hypothetical protein VJ912_02280 [Candidatus Nanoarchaeia archaeon]|nr:hypothetical protein [Candidatus Nanoarchaeia archaeon]
MYKEHSSKSLIGKTLIENYILKCPSVNSVKELPRKFKKYFIKNLSNNDFEKYDQIKYSKNKDDKIIPEKTKTRTICFKINNQEILFITDKKSITGKPTGF